MYCLLFLVVLGSLSLGYPNYNIGSSRIEVRGFEVATNSTIKIGIEYGFDKLNPVSSAAINDWKILDLIFDPLVIPNPYNYLDPDKDIPWLINGSPDWEIISSDMSVFTIKLRNDIFFSDGTKMTSEDIKFTCDLIKWMGDTSYKWQGLSRIIHNVTIIDNLTIKIYLDTTGYLASRRILSMIVFPKHIYEKAETWGGHEGIFPSWDVTPTVIHDYRAKSPTDPVLTGYGLFKIDSWEPESGEVNEISLLRLRRNDKYFMNAVDSQGNIIWQWHPITKEYLEEYGPDALRGPYAEYIEFVVMDCADEIKEAITSGEIDMGNALGLYKYYEYFSQKNISLGCSCHLSLMGALFNTREWPLNESAFRRALYYIFDREKICSEIYAGWATPLRSPLPKCMGNWSLDLPEPSQDFINYTEIALDELKSIGINDSDGDGWLEGPNGEEISIEIIGWINISVMNIMADNMRSIGIHAIASYMDFRELVTRMVYGNYQIIVYRMFMERLPYVLEEFTTPDILCMISRWENSTYDDIVYQAIYAEENITEAQDLVWDAQWILLNECPYAPLYETTIIGVYRSNETFKENGLVGVYANLVNDPVVNKYTLMKVTKPKAILTTITTTVVTDYVIPDHAEQEVNKELIAIILVALIMFITIIILIKKKQ